MKLPRPAAAFLTGLGLAILGAILLCAFGLAIGLRSGFFGFGGQGVF